MMSSLRRRLASCALAMLVCQTASVFAAPLSSCCPARHAATAPAAEAETECCPAGSHAPGQCPRHKRSNAPSTPLKVDCRMQCDAPHGVQFLLGVAGLVPPPIVSPAAPIVSRAVVVATADPQARPFVPESPPPRVR
jgi:hypothetical protein